MSQYSFDIFVLGESIEPPGYETRVSLVEQKARRSGIPLGQETVCYMVRSICTNVRHLEGALNTISAKARLSGKPITLSFVREALKEIIEAHDQIRNLNNQIMH